MGWLTVSTKPVYILGKTRTPSSQDLSDLASRLKERPTSGARTGRSPGAR